MDYLGYTKCFYAACGSQVIFHLHGDTAWAIVNSVFYGPPVVEESLLAFIGSSRPVR